MARPKKQLGNGNRPDSRAELEAAQTQFNEWTQLTTWRGSFDRPYRIAEQQIRALLGIWELAIGDISDADRRRLAKTFEEIEHNLNTMATLPKVARDHEFRVAIQHGRWILVAAELLLNRPSISETD